MTPFDAMMSAWITLAVPTITPLSETSMFTSLPLRVAAEERKRRLASLDSIDPPMLRGERRGEEASIKYGVAVREVSIVFRDKVNDHEEIRFG